MMHQLYVLVKRGLKTTWVTIALRGFCMERKDRDHGRAGGVVCYIRNNVLYNRLNDLEVDEFEVIWIKIMPKKYPENYSHVYC